MLSIVLCLLFVGRDVYGYNIGDEMKDTIQNCCNAGSLLARSDSDCSSSQPIPKNTPAAFGSLCIIARTQCCKDYFMKKKDCESGIDIAVTNSMCDTTTGTSKECCDDCIKGTAVGNTEGIAGCVARNHSSAEELLSADAFVQCCMKAANDGSRRTSSVATTKRPDPLASVCEEYAPNELCAHHCIPIPGSYKCECNPGFMLMADGRNCKEVVRNRCKPRNPCQHKCNDNGVEVLCSCRRGYELMPDGKSCQDIDECQLDMSVCLPNTQCQNIQGSYKCIPLKKNHKNANKGQCPPGFARNIKNNACDDINECALPNPPCPAYTCENTVGGYKCGGVLGDPANLSTTPRGTEDRCPPGFVFGIRGDCEDVDECATGKDDCNHMSQFCINTHSSFYCQDKVSKHCPPGFKINTSTTKCEDINECEEDSEVCRKDQICINQLGAYDCKQKPDGSRVQHKCPDGMRMDEETYTCEDINECVEGTHMCDQHQNCLNTNGSFECHCKIGYELDITTGACVDVNECATGQHDCIIGSQRCDNTVGSFLCIRITSCGTGYILQHSTGNCEDIDECALGTHNCARAGSEYQCLNIPGSFRCVRKRASTTTTTPQPSLEYEYFYYDSEEEISPSNSTSDTKDVAEPVSSLTTSTSTATPTSSSPVTSPSPTPIPLDTRPNTIPTEKVTERDDTRYTSTPERRTDPTTERQPTVPETYPEQNPPEIVYTESKPDVRNESPNSTYYETKDSKDPISNEIVPTTESPPEFGNTNYQTTPKVKPTYSPYSPFRPTSVTPPREVYVNVGQETATIPGHRRIDGSVVVDTKDIPKNTWTKINTKPSECVAGFELNENGGCFDIDECATNRHSCSGFTETCRNTIGGYVCDCAIGFRRDPVTGSCDLIVFSSTSTSTSTSTTTETPPPPPTSTTTTVPVLSTPRSRNLFWGYRDDTYVTTKPFRPTSWCDGGYHLNTKTGVCEDIDECTNGQANCAAVEICLNTQGGYRCECPPNWTLDEVRHRCVPVRSKGVFPPGYGNQPVYETKPSYEPRDRTGTGFKSTVDPQITQIEDRGTVLQCPWGYRVGDDHICVDVDECATGEAKCGLMQTCTNLPGSYSCSCPDGFKLVDNHQCEDINECLEVDNGTICSEHADCINTIGSFQCKCHSGFKPAPYNNKVCMDVDECAESRAGSLCQHRCNNVWGSYTCSCHRGYRLNSDNRTCSDVDECVQFKSKIPCVGQCYNEPGSYRCTCPPGYRLSEDKRSCIDIDECETGEATCQTEMYGGTSNICFNTRGSYRCHRITCPIGYQLESKHRCSKAGRQCLPGDWDCAHQPTTISYNFITFVSKLYIPESNVKLFTMRGPAWPYAKMKFELRLVDVNAPPSVRDRADINCFLLIQNDNEAVMSLVRPLEGPQTIELELSMELYSREQFGGIALAKLFIHVSEYEF